MHETDNTSGIYNSAGAAAVKTITTSDDFFTAINLPRIIIYLLVEWSGPERVSRSIVLKVINNIDLKGIPVYKIDCSNLNVKYVEDWMAVQAKGNAEFIYGGWGETLLVGNNKLLDFIQWPFKLGYEATKEKIEGWLNYIK